MKTYTPNELEKMPPCDFDPFGHCLGIEKKQKDPKHCVMCVMQRIDDDLCQGDLACAGRSLGNLLRILKELKVLPESVKFK